MTLRSLRSTAVAALVLSAAAGPGAGPAAAQEGVPNWPEAAAPGPDWQQEVHYTIEARLDEERDVLEGAASLEYGNASPEALEKIVLHLHLNAFRPGSRWAETERRERFDFASLEEPDYGFERLSSARIGETELEPVYPLAPDSTVVELPLPEPLAPGDSLTLALRWTARPSTLCRRQCRQGRSWDLAQWYPRIAVYDRGGWQAQPLLPQGEFYGEFGTYDVTLDLAEDQVVGATGVPVEGDPGWTPAEGSPLSEPRTQRGWYADRHQGPSPGLFSGDPEAGRKRVRFYAADVHHFGWSASPDYIYEGGVFDRGRLSDVAVHVLYRPGDSTWADGVAVERTIAALSWLETVFRPYPWPQLTNLHRLEGGGTEFPMVLMDGSAAEGLIVHEGTHQYAHGILANNEWKDAWLDEGLTSFLSAWYAEEHGAAPWTGTIEGMGRLEALLTARPPGDQLPEGLRDFLVDGDTLPAPLPVDTPSAAYANYAQYGAMSYSKPAAVFYMLRELIGKETMRRVLRLYYDSYEFRHVTEEGFRWAAETAAGRDLDWFFDQWLDTTATLDYGLGEVVTEETEQGRWRTTVEVIREGEAWMPVTLRVGSETRVLDARDRRQTVEVVTEERPETVELDPERVILDVDRSDDRKSPRAAS